MNNQQMTSILVLLVPQIIKEIAENRNISYDRAIDEFYHSNLYSVLEKEHTKLWHLSPKSLYELYVQEIDSGKIDYPEEA